MQFKTYSTHKKNKLLCCLYLKINHYQLRSNCRYLSSLLRNKSLGVCIGETVLLLICLNTHICQHFSAANPFLNGADLESNLIDNANIGAFYRGAITNLKSKCNVVPLLAEDCKVHSDPLIKVGLLDDYFGSVSSGR